MLLNHPSKTVTIDMVEPRHLQSGLQIAAHNLQFEFAQKFIQDHPESLLHLDRLGRTVFGTVLSIFVTTTFAYIEQQDRQKDLEDFCLYLLTKENPFQKVSEAAIPSMQVVLQSRFASFHPSDKAEQMSPLNGVKTIMLACPKFGAALLELAEKNPKGSLEHHYITHAKKYLEEVDQLNANLEKIAQIEKEK